MKEDLKTLEDFINKPTKSKEFNKITNNEVQAIQHLIKAYKELEELKDNNVLVRRYFDLKDSSIPKSLVKEKIEEAKLKNKKCGISYHEHERLFWKIKILQELLEKR